MAETRENCVTLTALLGLLKPTERLFVIRHMGAVDEYGRRVYSAEVAQKTFERNIKRRGERTAK